MKKTNTILDAFLENEYIKLKSEDGKILLFQVIGGLRYDSKYYGILSPVNDDKNFKKNQALIFEMEYNLNKEIQYTMVIDNDLAKIVFNKYMDFYKKAMDNN